MRHLLATLVVVGLAGCGGGMGGHVERPSVPGVSLGQEFSLRPGESASVGESALVVRFLSVTEDSRCPRNVQCIWEGDAVVAIATARGSASSQHDLHTSGRFPRQANEGLYRIELLRLEPLPVEGTKVSPADYTATFKIEQE